MENNGCCVIGTSNSINDTVARKLALEFYKSLNAGLHIEQSWRDAQNAIYDSYCKANKRDLVWEGMENEDLTGTELWDLYGEREKQWELNLKKMQEDTNETTQEALKKLLNEGKWMELLQKLDEVFADKPSYAYSVAKGNINHQLMQGFAPNPALKTAIALILQSEEFKNQLD
jgi:hypothetical protein